MPSPWYPKAKRMPSHRANPMAHNNNSKKLVLHTTEGPSTQSAHDLAAYVIHEAKEYSAVFNVHTGEFVQIYPVNTGARSLENGGIHGGVGCNRSGQIAFQVSFCGHTSEGEMLVREAMKHGFGDILDWLHNDWGIPLEDITSHGRSIDQWDKSGILCHANSPGNSHTDHVPVGLMLQLHKSNGAGHHQGHESGQGGGSHHGHPHGHESKDGGEHGQHHGGHHGHQHPAQHDDQGHGRKGAHAPPTHPDEPHYLVLVSDHGGDPTPLLNKDGAESGWTIDKAEAKEFPHGHIKYEHVDEAISWAREHGLVVEKVLRAKPADHHPDHEHKRHHKPDGKKGSGKLTKNASTHWPTDKRTVERLKNVAEDLGVELRIISGYRTYAEQARLYDGWIHHRPGFNLAAPPGKSNHNYGHAADTDVVKPDGSLVSIGNWPGARQALKKHGLVLSVASEAWHVDPKEVAHWANPPIP